MMATILEKIEEKYSYDDEDYGFIVFVSSSPETRMGMYPPIMTLCDFDIESFGMFGSGSRCLSHVAELDLTDNLLTNWSEIFLVLNHFSGLKFFNVSNNKLNKVITEEMIEDSPISNKSLPMKKLVMNGNKIDWQSINCLTNKMPMLEYLYVCNNDLKNPSKIEGNVLQHENLRQLYLSCNPLDDFQSISNNVGQNCPSLEHLSLAECPIETIPEDPQFENLMTLNLTTTKVTSWQEVDKLNEIKTLRELRLQRCPVLHEYTAHEKRMMLIARLPNILVLNGGGKITDDEREDAERAFIRYYLETDEKPKRYEELVNIHGKLDPLVNINMAPDTHVKVKICHNEDVREEVIKVYQTVQQFKTLLQQWFDLLPPNMRLFYCDKDLVEIAGPEEMKWPQKALYTYNVQNGDKFILDEKQNFGKSRKGKSSLKNDNGPGRISFILSPKIFNNNNNNNISKKAKSGCDKSPGSKQNDNN